jgi:hypothetical protein
MRGRGGVPANRGRFPAQFSAGNVRGMISPWAILRGVASAALAEGPDMVGDESAPPGQGACDPADPPGMPAHGDDDEPA